ELAVFFRRVRVSHFPLPSLGALPQKRVNPLIAHNLRCGTVAPAPSCDVMPVSVDACFTLRLSCPSSAIAHRSRQQRAASERRAVPAVPRTRPNPSREEGGPSLSVPYCGIKFSEEPDFIEQVLSRN